MSKLLQFRHSHRTNKPIQTNEQMIMLPSLFGFPDDIINDFLRADCEILAYYLHKRMKQQKHKCKVYFTSTDENDFIHVLLYFMGKYVGILGIHDHDQVCRNHTILYNIQPETELYFNPYKPGAFHQNMRQHMTTENQKDWDCAERQAKHIFNHSSFQKILTTRGDECDNAST